MALKKKKSAPKKGKKKNPYVVHKSNDIKVKKTKPSPLIKKNTLVNGSSLHDIKEMADKIPKTTHVPLCTSAPENNYETGFSREMKKHILHPSQADVDDVKEKAYKLIPPNISQLFPSRQTSNPTPSELNKNEGRHSVPITITVRNVTNYTLRDVKIFDTNHKDQMDVVYQTENVNMSYDDIIRRKNSFGEPKHKIGLVHITSNNQSQPFVTHWFTDTSIDGVFLRIPVSPRLDPNQNQNAVTILRYTFDFYIGMGLSIDSLAPDTKVSYSFYLMSA